MEVSPWLELARRPQYLHGHDFTEVASLGSLVDSAAEPLLLELSDSLSTRPRL